jgi:hypothetical protein
MVKEVATPSVKLHFTPPIISIPVFTAFLHAAGSIMYGSLNFRILVTPARLCHPQY